MKGMKIFEAMDGLRDEFITEAHIDEVSVSSKSHRRRGLAQSGLFAAAVSAVVALGVITTLLFALRGQMSRPTPAGSTPVSPVTEQGEPEDTQSNIGQTDLPEWDDVKDNPEAYDYTRLFTDLKPTWTTQDGCEKTADVYVPEDFAIPASFPRPDVTDADSWYGSTVDDMLVLRTFRFYVFRIEDGVAYLTTLGFYYGRNDTYALVGEVVDYLREGDYIRFSGARVYRTYANESYGLLDRVSLVRLTVEEVQKLYIRAGTRSDNISYSEKPILYLYPTAPTVCSVRLKTQYRLTVTYPAYGASGWQNFTAYPDGTLIFPDGMEYYALYWEGEHVGEWDFSTGFCVSGADTAAFLDRVLAEIGLSRREANEFITYWLPRMQSNPYNVISFQTDRYTDAFGLEITPAPDSLLRVFMAFYPSEAPVDIPAQHFSGFARNGFTVVEWGGTMCAAAHN